MLWVHSDLSWCLDVDVVSQQLATAELCVTSTPPSCKQDKHLQVVVAATSPCGTVTRPRCVTLVVVKPPCAKGCASHPFSSKPNSLHGSGARLQCARRGTLASRLHHVTRSHLSVPGRHRRRLSWTCGPTPRLLLISLCDKHLIRWKIAVTSPGVSRSVASVFPCLIARERLSPIPSASMLVVSVRPSCATRSARTCVGHIWHGCSE